MSKSQDDKQIGGEYGEIRSNIDVDRLNAYLAKFVTHIYAPVAVKQFKFGQSNPTYFLTDSGGTRFVLRKKPSGKLVSKTAHQIEREYTVLSAIHRHNINPSNKVKVPIPEPIHLCEDTSVIGTPFYIMEFLDGRIFTDARLPEVSPKDRRECWMSAIQTLAALSSLNPHALGLSTFGPSSAYFPRQIKSLSRVSLAQAEVKDVESNQPVGKIPLFDEMVTWYQSHLPDESRTGSRIVHGDYKMDNLVFHRTENRVIGILDWELCTLGSPLHDLANLTMPWFLDPRDSAGGPKMLTGFVNFDHGIPTTLEELERLYAKLTRQPYPVKDIVFARSWSMFRLAIISQGIAARYAQRQASSEDASLYAGIFPVVGSLAIKILKSNGEVVAQKSRL